MSAHEPGLAGAAPATPAATPLSMRLRLETHAAHEHVERAASFNRLIVVRIPESAPDAPPAERRRAEQAREQYREVYRVFLTATYGFEAAVLDALAFSPAAEAACASGYPPEAALATDLIRADVASVFGAEATGALVAMPGLPMPLTLPELVGIEYVRRGSRMGGAVIASVVEQTLGLDRAHGASFLGQYGRETRAAFGAVRAWIDGLTFTSAEAAAAVAAAGRTFEAIGEWHRRMERSTRG
jgi:heme oxygenase